MLAPLPDRGPGGFVVRAGRLISEREPLDRPPGLRAPAEAVEERPQPSPRRPRAARRGADGARRARPARDYWGPASDALTASYD
ncbi:hypothetical protein [Streptomyces sp. NPDC004270]